MAMLSWFLFAQLYDSGDMDRDADRKAIKSKLKSVKTNKSSGECIHESWMKFGSGFYGLAALWTFVAIEATDLFNFVFNFLG